MTVDHSASKPLSGPVTASIRSIVPGVGLAALVAVAAVAAAPGGGGFSDPGDGDRAPDRHRAQPVGAASLVPARDRVLPEDDPALGGCAPGLARGARRDRGARLVDRRAGRRRDGDHGDCGLPAGARVRSERRLWRARRRRHRGLRRLGHAGDLHRGARLQGQGGRRRLRGGRRQRALDLGDGALSDRLRPARLSIRSKPA